MPVPAALLPHERFRGKVAVHYALLRTPHMPPGSRALCAR